MTDTIFLESFTKKNNKKFYDAYLEIKYQVFVAEQGWHSLGNESGRPIAKEDPFDDQGRFCLATTDEGIPIGVVRGIPLTDGFPHRDLLEHHFRLPEVASIFEYFCTLNALAVIPPYRQKKYQVFGSKWSGSVAKLLMLAIISSLKQEGLRAAIATAGGFVSARLCTNIGFFVIDRPSTTPLHYELMTNIGLVFGSEGHVEAQMECGMQPKATLPLEHDTRNLLRYFEQRQQVVLGSKVLESFF